MRSIYKSLEDLEINKLYHLFHYMDDKPSAHINMCVRITGIGDQYVVFEKADRGPFFDRDMNHHYFLTLPIREIRKRWYVT